MKPGGKAKYEEYCKKINELFIQSEPPRGSKYEPEPHLRCYPEDDKITLKLFMMLPERLSPAKEFEFPVGLREGLKDVDQKVKFKVLFGVNGDEILKSDKPLAEHFL